MRRWLVLLVLSVFLVGVAPAPAGAKEPDAAAEKKDDLFGRALDLGIYTVIVFLLLLFLLTRYAWRPILAGLDERERHIASAVEESRKAREEAIQLRKDLEEVRQKGYAEIRELMQKAREDAARLKEQTKAETAAEVQTERERLRREIDLAKDHALHELAQQATDLATLVSSKVVRRQLSPEDHRALIDEAIAEMHQAVEERQRVLAHRAHA